ncbi:MAG: excinuclease ABC subunit UvrC [Flavobacteriales bacterium]|nr:excinuclease ABC subunit UvrC [Flavobacteriales bacterium]MDG1396364.1 excinuclease ABC subunit UvrC [Flavobacteriales bacterium]
MPKTKEHIAQFLKTLPNSAGVYQYYDKEDAILYVGKAKNLKRRVSSYFHKEHTDYGKTRVLVSKIERIAYIVVASEVDALLLENNLIKKLQPRYNVMLKDDKTYPWICIKKERFPRVFSVRNVVKNGSEYFGPYSSSRAMRVLLELIKQLYPLRSCTFNLSQENIENGKFKVCLDYHIKKCLGACESKQSEEDYNQSIAEIRSILKGNTRTIIQPLKEQMQTYAASLEFEKAQEIKEKLDTLENYQSKSTVVSPSIHNVDVFTVLSDTDSAYINYFKIVNGAIIQSHNLEIKKKLAEADEDLLTMAVIEIREKFHSNTKEIILNKSITSPWEEVSFHVPQRGDKKALVDLSLRNAQYMRQEKLKKIQILDPERHIKRVLEQLQKDLRLSELPVQIECFDNSNIQGTNPASACVVFKNAKPSKKDYRHFNIKTVEGPDDFASMEEVVYRRYKRLKEENQPFPQLIIIDGGKGQLSSSLKALDKLQLRGVIAIVGIAKRLEEIYFPGDSVPLYIDKRSESLKLIQHLRNEAHRFSLAHHRNRRSKSGLHSELDDISGIGPKSKIDLLKKFKSIKRIKEASKTELTELLGQSKAQKLMKYFKDGESKN